MEDKFFKFVGIKSHGVLYAYGSQEDAESFLSWLNGGGEVLYEYSPFSGGPIELDKILHLKDFVGPQAYGNRVLPRPSSNKAQYFDVAIDFYPGIEEGAEEKSFCLEVLAQAKAEASQMVKDWLKSHYPDARLLTFKRVPPKECPVEYADEF